MPTPLRPNERGSNIVPFRLVRPNPDGDAVSGGSKRPRSTAPPPGLAPVAGPPRPFVQELFDWREPYLIPAVVLLIVHAILWAAVPYAGEDAYITFRYARNLALGNGLTYNPGERVMGFTSPLWTLWNALGFAVMKNPALWSRATCVLADAATLLVVTHLLRARSRTAAWIFAALFAGWTYFPSLATSGMETGVMVTLMAASAALAARRHVAAGPALGALALMRPEGVVAAAILSLGAGWRDRLLALAMAAAGYAALTAYFGSPIPQSVVAKAQIYAVPGLMAGRHWWEWALPISFGRWPVVTEGQFLFVMTVVAGPAAVYGAWELWKQRGGPLFWLTLAGLAIWAGYAASGAAYFWWYLAAPLATWFLLVALGLPRIVRGPAIYVAGGLFILGTWSIVVGLYTGRGQAEAGFAKIGWRLSEKASGWQSVMLEPIGLVGYIARVRVIDEVGLVTPAVAKRRATGEPGWYADIVNAARPDWLVLRRGALTTPNAFAGRGRPFRSVAERDTILARYQVDAWLGEEKSDAALGLFRRVRP